MPQSGRTRVVDTMNVMKFAELTSSGAALTSVFHQLLAGNSGSGTGIGPPCVAARAALAEAIRVRATMHQRTIARDYRRESA